MQIEVTLYGELKQYSPDGRNTFSLTMMPEATLGDLLASLSIPRGNYVALINGRRVSPEACFKSGDSLVMFFPADGG